MMRRKGHRLAVVVAAGALLLASCGSNASTTTAEPQLGTTGETTGTAALTETTATPPGDTATTIVVEECMEPATEVEFGLTIDSQVAADEFRVYLCVEVPEGVTLLRFELTEETGELMMDVGHPHLENVQEGGFVGVEFWRSEAQDGVRVVVMEPLVHQGGLLEEDTEDEFVRPGSYYIDLYRSLSDSPVPFTLSVTQGEVP